MNRFDISSQSLYLFRFYIIFSSYLTFLINFFFFFNLLLFSDSCPTFFPLPHPTPFSCSPTVNHPGLSMPTSPLFMFLCLTLPLLSPIIPLLPVTHSFFLYFIVSGSILLISLFCWLGSTYRWDHMVFVFHCLAYFT